MINIRPVSDLRNNFTEIESIVKQGDPVYLTKNGYGTMVVMDLQQYAALTDDIELKLDEADKAAEADDKRYTVEEVFGRARERVNGSSPLLASWLFNYHGLAIHLLPRAEEHLGISDRKSTRLNSSHNLRSRMPSSA